MSQVAVNAIRANGNVTLADVQAIAAAMFCAVKASSGSHLKPQQDVMDMLADISNYIADELTQQEQQAALEMVEWQEIQKSALVRAMGFGPALQALQNLSVRGGV